MLCYIIEEVLPKDYYTSMVSLMADVNLLVLFLNERCPDLSNHLRSVNFELPMVVVELFITIFTASRTELSDVVMDHFLIDGSRTYFKAVLFFFELFKDEIMMRSEFCIPK